MKSQQQGQKEQSYSKENEDRIMTWKPREKNVSVVVSEAPERSKRTRIEKILLDLAGKG